MPSGRLAPVWAQLGHALFANGERLCHYHLDTLKVDEYLSKTG